MSGQVNTLDDNCTMINVDDDNYDEADGGEYMKPTEIIHKELSKMNKHRTTTSTTTQSSANGAATKCNSKVSIKLSAKPYQVITHHATISYEEFIGTVGGHIGIWLGLSIYKLISFVIHNGFNVVVRLLRCMFQKMNSVTVSE